jgi:RNA polymerase sigma-70 factor (ECF subfamily)
MPDWTAAYQEHGAIVRRYLARRMRPEDAEDLAQETFVRAMASPKGLRDETKVRSYLLRTAHNLLLNFRRRKKWVRAENELGRHTSLEDLAGGRPDDAQAQVALRELREAVQAVLLELPADQQLAFRWGILEKRPYREICECTGWTLSKVKVDVHRARKALLDRLESISQHGEDRNGPLRRS